MKLRCTSPEARVGEMKNANKTVLGIGIRENKHER
jgi:hypothetical protein